MFGVTGTSPAKTTSYKVVLPFYFYAALSLLVASFFLFTSDRAFLHHYFHPHLLAITHLMALGWGTMVILGASHQLVPVLIEGKLYSEKLAHASFILAAVGIPLLVYGFYFFDMGHPAKWGGRLVLLSILAYLINVGVSIGQSKKINVQAVYVATSVGWLFITGTFGLMLVYNFTFPFLGYDSIHFLPLHVHAGVVGWFLLLVLGVASRLIPMFLISKYQNDRLLWVIYFLVNGGLLLYIALFYFAPNKILSAIPIGMIFAAIVLFIKLCYAIYKKRIRRQVDDQMKVSLLSVAMILAPILLLLAVVVYVAYNGYGGAHITLGYGFLIFFGWLTAIILGMTFKTLPFIVWNKVYHKRSFSGQTPNPKDMFDALIFKIMSVAYLSGFVVFFVGILTKWLPLIQLGALLLIASAVLYNWNVIKVLIHKAKQK
ncbi:MAG: cytochrome C oxidase subunit I [Bacteroidales bacterium]|nr:cytochrome C oxidase subunit I [Bacteroidales bacterium]